MAGSPSLFTIPAGISFARALSKGVIDRIGDDPLALADVLIFVPTRRAARSLQQEFALQFGGAALGPRIRALGDVGDEDIAFDPSTDDLDLPPAIAPLRRRLLLATLVEHWAQARGAALPFTQAVAHAEELARFLDEATTQSADLSTLKDLAPAALAAHWQEVVGFLDIIALQWPLQLEAEGAMEPASRRDAILRALGDRLAHSPPKTPVIAAGSTGSIPATAELLKTIAHLPQGMVVLPGLDRNLDRKSWDELEPAHAQFGLRQLLTTIGADREDVKPWPYALHDGQAQRVRFLSEALRPPPTTDRWRELVDGGKAGLAAALDGMALVEAATSREEALVIAIAMRVALETPGRSAALVTPDRGLARRVAAELARWDIAVDDSAGTILSRTPPGTFLSLLARAVAERFAPVPLLALLKHPFAAGGQARVAFLDHVRDLERRVLHGLRPAPGLSGIGEALTRRSAPKPLRDWVAGVAQLLSPFAETVTARDVSLPELARTHAQAAEALAATDTAAGETVLWKGETGAAAATLIAELIEQGDGIALSDAFHYADLFRDLAEARVVRPAYGRHPRLAILGAQEARLLHFDLVILGGLNEGTWPGDAAIDPWLSRPMRQQLGLEAPERRIGQAAHDFATLASGAQVLLTRALRQEGAPTNASRWLLRIEQLAKGLGLDAKLTSGSYLLNWAREIDAGPRAPRATRPKPSPPVSVRPRGLRVTEIETWLRDPYALYARHILKLDPLDPIDAEPGPRERGIAIHKALERFLLAFPDALPDYAYSELLRFGQEAFTSGGATPALLALWWPRYLRAARWFLDFETGRRRIIDRAMVEQKGRLIIDAPGGPFTLSGRADRIDLFAHGAAAIVDYKTGGVPTQKQINSLLAPQLPLEAAMLLRGAFKDVHAGDVRDLLHIRLTGGVPPGDAHSFSGDATAKAHEALARLAQRIARYDDPAQPYVSHEIWERLAYAGDYDHLARVREWSLGPETDE